MTAIGIDVGGTHTDVVVIGDDGRMRWTDKVPSNPSAPVEAIRAALAGVPSEGPVDVVVNGTTIGINALLQGNLPRVGLVATRGFPDLLYIRRETKENIYDLQWRKPRPLVPRDLSFELDERIDVDGKVLIPLGDLSNLITWVGDHGLTELAVCLIHSYRNDVHERRVQAALSRELPDVRVTLSSDVWPEWREFERTYNTALNAALKPILGAYLDDLVRAVRESLGHDRVRVMHADGGILGLREIAERPVLTLLSGTVAGALAGARAASLAGFEYAVSLDMGGTSTDLSLSHNGRPRRSAELSIEWEGTLGFAGVDVVSIGAGGGSVVWTDEGGGLHIGPKSAGADPGPAAARRGGTEPTLTDAYLLLGYLGSDPIIGGRTFDMGAARTAFEPLESACGLTADELWLGAYRIATANLAAGIKRVTIERGVDPRTCALACFGGAGPLHAAQLVHDARLAAAIVPPRPGNASALGLLLAPLKHSVSQTYFGPLDGLESAGLSRTLHGLERRAVSLLPDSADEVNVEWFMSLRYRGQTRELAIEVPADQVRLLDGAARAAVAEAFHARHLDEYTFASEGEPIELVSVRCDAVVPMDEPGRQFGAVSEADAYGEASGRMADASGVVFASDDGRPTRVTTRMIRRGELSVGAELQGPAVILDLGATILVPPGARARIDVSANLIIDWSAP